LDDWDSTDEKLEALAYPRQFKPGYVRFIREKQRTHHALRPHMANNPWVFISWVVKEIVSDDEFKAWKRACQAFAPQHQEARREMPPAQPEPAPMPEPPAPEKAKAEAQPVAPEPQPDWAAEAPQEPAEAAPVAAKPGENQPPPAPKAAPAPSQSPQAASSEPPGNPRPTITRTPVVAPERRGELLRIARAHTHTPLSSLPARMRRKDGLEDFETLEADLVAEVSAACAEDTAAWIGWLFKSIKLPKLEIDWHRGLDRLPAALLPEACRLYEAGWRPGFKRPPSPADLLRGVEPDMVDMREDYECARLTVTRIKAAIRQFPA
jgi:hypothetical protein